MHHIFQIPLYQVGNFKEIYGQNAIYTWHLPSVEELSEEILCGQSRVQRKDPVPRLWAGEVGTEACMTVVTPESITDPLSLTL